MEGVVRTRVGYAGGKKRNPTYYDLDDHSETLEIDYDPTRASYGKLLEVFWGSHDPQTRPWSRQYASIVFYHNDEQRRLAVESKNRVEARLGKKVYTEIRPYTGFYLAEDYHQKYFLRHMAPLRLEYASIYPDTTDYMNSTAAARVNGYIGGYGELGNLRANLDRLGLSEEGKSLLARVGERLAR
jgi:methionine-S-sulfoxide reductase